MISDAIHSASDVFSTVVVMIGLKLASKKADKEHPYGHERMECVADAWHHRSDALSSVGALVGIGGAMLGFPVMDAVASLVIFVFIVKAAYDIFKDAMDKMVDHSCDAKTEKQI